MSKLSTIVFVATLLLIASLVTSLSAESKIQMGDGGLQGRILAAKKGTKKKADLGPKRPAKKPAAKKKGPKNAKEEAKAKKGAADAKVGKAKRSLVRREAHLKLFQQSIKKAEKRHAAMHKNVMALRKKFKAATTKKAKYRLLTKILKHVNIRDEIKERLARYKKEIEASKAKVARAVKRVEKAKKNQSKVKKVDPKTGKKVIPQASSKELAMIKKIQETGLVQRAKLWNKHWGKKVSLAGNIKDLSVTLRFQACIVQTCSKMKATQRAPCRIQCRKQWS